MALLAAYPEERDQPEEDPAAERERTGTCRPRLGCPAAG